MVNEEKDKNLKNNERILSEKDVEKVSGGRKRRPVLYGSPEFFRKRREEKKLRERLVDVVDTESGEFISENVSSSNEVLDEDDAGRISGGKNNHLGIDKELYKKLQLLAAEEMAYGGPNLFEYNWGFVL